MPDIYDIVYVKTDGYSASSNPVIAEEVERINRMMLEERREYILVGPGRWGSSDSWLGIPVKWPAISGARVIVECGLHFECRTLLTQDMTGDRMDPRVIDYAYPEHDFHTIFFGEILECYRTDV